MSKSSSRQSGFTVIEIVIVITIIGILAVLAIPRFDSYYRIKLNGVARKMAADIRYTQVLASTTHLRHGIIFLTNQERYGIYHTVPSYANVVTDPLTRQPFIVDFLSPGDLQGVTIETAVFSGLNRVEFDYRGEPTSAGSVRIQFQGRTADIVVAATTGRVSIQ